MARIVRGFCEFAGTITIVRYSAPFRAIRRHMERGFARPGADLGADSGADFIFERRGIVGGLALRESDSSSDHLRSHLDCYWTHVRYKYCTLQKPAFC